MQNYTEADIRRFYQYVTVDKPNECWEWFGSTVIVNGIKRGQFYFDRRQINATRFIYWFTTGIWPGELFVCHSCDNPLCVNPKHLWLGTQKDNIQDAVKKGRMANGNTNAAKLTETEVREIRKKVATGSSQRKLAVEYSVSGSCINSIIMHRSWKHIN